MHMGFRFLPDSYFSRLFVLMGGNILQGGYIQFFLYFLFFRGILEIAAYSREVRREAGALEQGVLAEKEQYVYYRDDINELKLRVIEEEETSPRTLFRLVKMGATKYLRTGSVTEVLEVITAQVRIIQNRVESGHSTIRYAAWALPALGFLGTVWGISSALGVARKVVQEGDISEITSTLGVAFDTTFVALFLSLILMFLYHRLQEKTDLFFSNLEDYIIENFVNRIARE
jgi:chemotaxis protein MotA